jgi:DNA ligase (NAD+)
MTDIAIQELRSLILKAKHAYYYSGEPIMSDAEYDALEDQLRQMVPEDPVLALVGSPIPADTILTKARHSIPMGSQSKVNSEAEFMAWAQKSEGSAIHASLKGDGASAAAYYQQGRLVQAISRGDGTIGEDITANAMRFKGVPAWVGSEGQGFTGAVRFEVILTVDEWTAIDPSRSKNPRNAGNGIMGRKNGHQSDRLTAYAFDIDETVRGESYRFATEAEKAQRLIQLGFNLIPQRLCSTTEEAVAYFRETAEQREAVPFWIDGVVLKMNDLGLQERMGVTSGRPKGQVAWKFDSSGAETVLTGVVISGGHTGAIVPTGQLRPVEIGGTTVSSVSLVNFDEIARLNLAVGDSVWVIKANDIIPKVVRVTHRPEHRQPILAPQSCPFCGGEVGRRINTGGDEGVILDCRNAACPKKSSGKINRWISSLDILGIGDVVLESMLEQLQIEDAADLYTLKDRFNELANLVTHAERDLRLGEKRANNILEAIEAKRVLTLSEFLGSLGLEHLGKRRVEIMIRAAQGELDTLDDWRIGKLRDPHVAELAGAPNIAAPIQDGIDAMAAVIDKLLANGVEVLTPQEDLHGSAESEEAQRPTVCISGKLPSGKKKADYQEPLRAAGYELVDEVSKDLRYLVLADAASTSSKAVKARKLGVRVISEEELVGLLLSSR